MMRSGVSASVALAALHRADAGSQMCQVAMLDAASCMASRTGSRETPAAGPHVGKTYPVQADTMRNDRVWPAMARAFEMTPSNLSR